MHVFLGKELEVSVIAKESTTILFFNIDKIINTCNKACKHHQKIIQNLLLVSSKNNIILTRKISHLSKRTTRDKILSYLSSQFQLQNTEEILIPFNRQQLADYLAVDRSALSNELSKMQKDGIISYTKNTFILH